MNDPTIAADWVYTVGGWLLLIYAVGIGFGLLVVFGWWGGELLSWGPLPTYRVTEPERWKRPEREPGIRQRDGWWEIELVAWDDPDPIRWIRVAPVGDTHA